MWRAGGWGGAARFGSCSIKPAYRVHLAERPQVVCFVGCRPWRHWHELEDESVRVVCARHRLPHGADRVLGQARVQHDKVDAVELADGEHRVVAGEQRARPRVVAWLARDAGCEARRVADVQCHRDGETLAVDQWDPGRVLTRRQLRGAPRPGDSLQTGVGQNQLLDTADREIGRLALVAHAAIVGVLTGAGVILVARCVAVGWRAIDARCDTPRRRAV